jgi:undecaprenyl-phosphate 4-deoxy-4-formamido-L-arabinose transferase
MTSTINLSIVIPVYKAELTLRKLYEELTREIKLIKRSYEVIFVEDGGGDGSWKIIKELISIDKHVK